MAVLLPSIVRPREGGGISTLVIAYGFAAIILIGTLLLMLRLPPPMEFLLTPPLPFSLRHQQYA